MHNKINVLSRKSSKVSGRLTKILFTFICILVATSMQAQSLSGLYEKAKEQDADAYFTLGSYYMMGTKVQRDFAFASYLFEFAADNNIFNAKCILSTCYMKMADSCKNPGAKRMYRNTAYYWCNEAVTFYDKSHAFIEYGGGSLDKSYYNIALNNKKWLRKNGYSPRREAKYPTLEMISNDKLNLIGRGIKKSSSSTSSSSSSSSTGNTQSIKKQEGRCAHIKDVKFEFDVHVDGMKGMYFLVDFDISTMKDKKCQCCVYIHHTDNTKFFNSESNGYKTSENQISGSTIFYPPYDSTTYTGLKIFIPYSSLRVNNTSRVDVKARVSIYDITDSKWIDDGYFYSNNFNVTW